MKVQKEEEIKARIGNGDFAVLHTSAEGVSGPKNTGIGREKKKNQKVWVVFIYWSCGCTSSWTGTDRISYLFWRASYTRPCGPNVLATRPPDFGSRSTACRF